MWQGDFASAGYGSQSEADAALLSMLHFWTGGDKAWSFRLFEQSGLNRDKWDREDYREATWQHVADGETYSPQRSKARSVASEYFGSGPAVERQLIEPPPMYSPPPLNLLPAELRDYVLAASESLAVDVSYILLPLLSAMGMAVGNSRIVQLKPGFVQPPIIWTGIIGRSGSKKSPALDEGTFAIRERERDFIRQNFEVRQSHERALAEWEAAQRKERGLKPTPPPMLTGLMDDLTLASLAAALVENPRGLLVKKDELSHWFESFDQFTNAHGADVSRWLSLHTGVLFAYDRKTEHERHRLFNPRVCIAGGIQPKTLRRCLTEDFFDRGLPARFLFACPPGTTGSLDGKDRAVRNPMPSRWESSTTCSPLPRSNHQMENGSQSWSLWTGMRRRSL